MLRVEEERVLGKVVGADDDGAPASVTRTRPQSMKYAAEVRMPRTMTSSSMKTSGCKCVL